MPLNPTCIKERILSAINTVVPIQDYKADDYLFSIKYSISAVDMVYILQKLAVDFNFSITDEWIDSLEMCSFKRLEELLGQYSDTV